MEGIILTNDGKVKAFGNVEIGTWYKRDVWKEENARNGRDWSGCKLVHYFYCFQLNNGKSNKWCYTKTEAREAIRQAVREDWRNILEIAEK